MADIRKKFDRQMHRLIDRQRAVTSSEVEWRAEWEVVQNKVERGETKIAKTHQLMDNLNKEVHDLMAATTAIKVVADLAVATWGCDCSSGMSGGGEEEVVVIASNIQTLLGDKKRIEVEVEKLQQDADQLGGGGGVVQQLEREKKTHAAMKRFKEAANCARELKIAEGRLGEVHALMAAKEQELQEVQHRLGERQEQQQRLLEEVGGGRRERLTALLQMKGQAERCREEVFHLGGGGLLHLVAEVVVAYIEVMDLEVQAIRDLYPALLGEELQLQHGEEELQLEVQEVVQDDQLQLPVVEVEVEETIRLAKELLVELFVEEELLQKLTDQEEFDEAEVVFCNIGSMSGRLDNYLLVLGWTREELQSSAVV